MSGPCLGPHNWRQVCSAQSGAAAPPTTSLCLPSASHGPQEYCLPTALGSVLESSRPEHTPHLPPTCVGAIALNLVHTLLVAGHLAHCRRAQGRGHRGCTRDTRFLGLPTSLARAWLPFTLQCYNLCLDCHRGSMGRFSELVTVNGFRLDPVGPWDKEQTFRGTQGWPGDSVHYGDMSDAALNDHKWAPGYVTHCHVVLQRGSRLC